MEELVSARILSHWQVVQAQLFRAVYAFFSHSCCMFLGFFTAKALQEMFSQIFHSSPQRSNGPALRRTYKTFINNCYGCIKLAMPIYTNIHLFYINNSNNSLTVLNLTDYLVYFFLTWCSFKNKCNLGREG